MRNPLARNILTAGPYLIHLIYEILEVDCSKGYSPKLVDCHLAIVGRPSFSASPNVVPKAGLILPASQGTAIEAARTFFEIDRVSGMPDMGRKADGLQNTRSDAAIPALITAMTIMDSTPALEICQRSLYCNKPRHYPVTTVP
jgi:hypothetical protein